MARVRLGQPGQGEQARNRRDGELWEILLPWEVVGARRGKGFCKETALWASGSWWESYQPYKPEQALLKGLLADSLGLRCFSVANIFFSAVSLKRHQFQNTTIRYVLNISLCHLISAIRISWRAKDLKWYSSFPRSQQLCITVNLLIPLLSYQQNPNGFFLFFHAF